MRTNVFSHTYTLAHDFIIICADNARPMKFIPRLTKRLMRYLFGAKHPLAKLTRKSKLFDRFIRKALFDGDNMIVVPKDDIARSRNIPMDISIEDGGNRTVLPSEVVKSVLRNVDDIFIMNFCLCRRSNRCEDYPVERGCIFIGDGVRKIPPEMGRMATAEEAIEYLDECAALGLVHIIGKNKVDRVWLSTGKSKLMTICNCCPCCCLWTVTGYASEGINSVFTRMPGVEISLDANKCIGCGMCQDICFTRAVTITDGKCSIDQKGCRGCGRCADICPADAITITYDESVIDSEVSRFTDMVRGDETKS